MGKFLNILKIGLAESILLVVVLLITAGIFFHFHPAFSTKKPSKDLKNITGISKTVPYQFLNLQQVSISPIQKHNFPLISGRLVEVSLNSTITIETFQPVTKQASTQSFQITPETQYIQAAPRSVRSYTSDSTFLKKDSFLYVYYKPDQNPQNLPIAMVIEIPSMHVPAPTNMFVK